MPALHSGSAKEGRQAKLGGGAKAQRKPGAKWVCAGLNDLSNAAELFHWPAKAVRNFSFSCPFFSSPYRSNSESQQLATV